jgi:hypothetical protein
MINQTIKSKTETIKAMSNSKNENIWIERKMILAPVFRKLNGRAKDVLLLFLYRRQWTKSEGKKGKWYTTNDGQIVFPYKEAQKRFHIPRSTFTRAIDNLIEYGFIDIARLGGGLIGDCTKYSISNRWEEYGTDKFVQKTRPKDTRGFGFNKKNWEEKTGKKRREKSKLGIKNDTRTSNNNDTNNYTNEGKCRTQIVSKMMQDNLDVNFFMKKGEEVFQTLSNSHPQKRYCSITSHPS